MKAVRYAIPVILLIALALSSGCLSKRYFFNFRTENDFIRNDGTWATANSNFSFGSDGLLTSDNWAAAPHFYNGDFTVTWEFTLDCVDGVAEQLEIFLSSKAGWAGADWYGGIAFWNMGTPSAVYTTYYNPGGSLVYPDFEVSYDGILDETGLNEVQIIKVGSWLTFKINDTSVGDGFEITGYDFDTFCPNIWCFQDIGDRSILFRSVEIKYSGDQILRL